MAGAFLLLSITAETFRRPQVTGFYSPCIYHDLLQYHAGIIYQKPLTTVISTGKAGPDK